MSAERQDTNSLLSKTVSPFSPVSPVIPVSPVNPVSPVSPVSVRPVSPARPVRPARPVTPAINLLYLKLNLCQGVPLLRALARKSPQQTS